MNPISSEDLQILVTGYVLGDLSDEEAQAFETLRRSPQTAGEVARLIEQTQQALDATFLPKDIAPAPALRQRLLNSFATSSAESSSEQSTGQTADCDSADSDSTVASTNPISGLPRWAKVLGLLAVAAIAGLSVSNYSLWRSQQLQSQSPESQRPETDPSESRLTLRLTLEPTSNLPEAITNASAAKIDIALDTRQLQGSLTLEALPPPPADSVYVLWTVIDSSAPVTTDAKNAILTYVFSTETEAREQRSFLLPPVFQQMPEAVTAIAITLEDAAAPQAHESSPIFISKL